MLNRYVVVEGDWMNSSPEVVIVPSSEERIVDFRSSQEIQENRVADNVAHFGGSSTVQLFQAQVTDVEDLLCLGELNTASAHSDLASVEDERIGARVEQPERMIITATGSREEGGGK